MATTVVNNESFPRTCDQMALELQFELGKLSKGEGTTLQVLELHRVHMKTIAQEALRHSRVREVTKEDRKDSEAWAACVDLQREDVDNRAKRWLEGL